MGKNQSTWGGGGTSGKRIPDSEDKPVSKGYWKDVVNVGRSANKSRAKMPRGAGVDHNDKLAHMIGRDGKPLAVGAATGAAVMASRRKDKEPVGKGEFTIPAAHIARGGKVGRKQLKGAAEQAAQSTWKQGMVGKALPGSAMAHMMPTAAPMKALAPKSAKPVTSLKPTKPKPASATYFVWHVLIPDTTILAGHAATYSSV